MNYEWILFRSTAYYTDMNDESHGTIRYIEPYPYNRLISFVQTVVLIIQIICCSNSYYMITLWLEQQKQSLNQACRYNQRKCKTNCDYNQFSAWLKLFFTINLHLSIIVSFNCIGQSRSILLIYCCNFGTILPRMLACTPKF